MKLGVCYYPEHVDPSFWKPNAKSMKELGILYVRVAEFCWSRVEPRRGHFDFAWLDKAVQTLADEGLKIVMCTPTATPPKWLIDEHPSILAAGADGHVRGFGSRRHYSFSSEVYRKESARITKVFAEHYGAHPAVAGWQTDNEYGCHDTTLCYSKEALKAFRRWLEKKYGQVAKLNEAWGNVFWSMEYGSFDEVELPNLTVTETNPSHRLDFYRFSSDQVVSFNREQVEILRRHSPGRWITHNSMGMFFDYDHYELCKDLDFVSWDNYPLGFLASFKSFPAKDKTTYIRTGHPDLSPFMHDLFRGQSKQKKFWIMEQQPGPVNWAPYNPVPEKGILRHWIWQGFAHGAETVSCFRWRQCGFAQEQEHAGLNYNDHQLTPFGEEFGLVSQEIARIEKHIHPKPNPAVALLFDYESIHRVNIQRQGSDYDPVTICLNFYSAARSLGLNVDILPTSADLAGYDMVLVPCLIYAGDDFIEKLIRHPGKVILGPRCFSKTKDFQIPKEGVPFRLNKFFENQLGFSESLPGSFREEVVDMASGKSRWEFSYWREYFRMPAKAHTELVFSDGSPACLQKGNLTYLGFFPEIDFLSHFIGRNLSEPLKACALPLPEGIRRTRRHNLIYYFNTAAENFMIPLEPHHKVLIGEQKLKRNQVTIVLDESRS